MSTRIGLAGDWHSRINWALHILNVFNREGITDIYQLGDFGLLPDEEGDHYLNGIQSALEQHGQTLFVILGNHEDYSLVENFISSEDHEGWMTTGNHDRILFATRGQRWEIEGVSFLALGGANSINRYDLTEWVSWWSGEQISLADTYRSIDGGKVDVMLTHDAPLDVPLFKDGEADNAWSVEALAYARKSRETLQYVVDAVQPEFLFHGHYHRYEDHIVEGDGYQMRSVCLDMNDRPNNAAVLSLPDRILTVLDY